MIAAQCAPITRDHGAGRAVGGLAAALRALGHDVRVAVPRYATVDLGRIGAVSDVRPYAVPMDHRGEMATVYRANAAGDVPVYLVDDPRYFGAGSAYVQEDDGERFIFFARAALELFRRPELAWRPDIVHSHDWQTGIVPNWLATIYRDDPALSGAASILTVHDVVHQGILGYHVLELAGLRAYGFITHPDIPELAELVNLLGRGIMYADVVTTVSKNYAREIQTPAFGERLDPLFRELGERLVGITNGVDTEGYDPGADEFLAATYGPDTLERRAANKDALQRALGLAPDTAAPLIAMNAHLEAAAGWDLLTDVLEPIVALLGAHVALLGSGERTYEELVSRLGRRYPGRIARQGSPDARLEHLLYAGCDLFLAPPRVEPNGSAHLLAMHYGAVPVVHATGGLADAVRDYDDDPSEGNGFCFSPYDAWALYAAVVRAIEVYRHPALWRPLQRRCLAHDVSWETPAARYVDVYRWALAHRCPQDAAHQGRPEGLSADDRG